METMCELGVWGTRGEAGSSLFSKFRSEKVTLEQGLERLRGASCVEKWRKNIPGREEACARALRKKQARAPPGGEGGRRGWRGQGWPEVGGCGRRAGEAFAPQRGVWVSSQVFWEGTGGF